MKRLGILFDGQGSQYSGMGKDLYQEYPSVRNMYKSLAKELKLTVEQLFNLDSTEVRETAIAQPFTFTFQASLTKITKEALNLDNSLSYGHSLGMYNAFLFANMLSFDDLLPVVVTRAKLMSKAAHKQNTTMIAAFSNRLSEIKPICNSFPDKKVTISNLNSPNQVVIGGNSIQIDLVEQLLKDIDIPTKKLSVSGAFHTSYMKSASREFRQFLQNYEPIKKITYVPEKVMLDTMMNGLNRNFSEICVNQITTSTNFVGIVKEMNSKGISEFVEVGPKRVLNKFIRDINPNSVVTSISNSKDILKLSHQRM